MLGAKGHVTAEEDAKGLSHSQQQPDQLGMRL